ncbi:hypothetical protein GEV43_40000 [Actinomadura sp. J1-007]|nr:hypothetical protein [Actinomadura sp. J1-007]
MGAREQRAIIGAYAQTTGQMRASLLAVLLTLWRGLGSWRDGDQAGFLRAAVPQALGAQRQMASLTDAYLAALLADMRGGPPRPTGAPAPTGAQLRGVDPEVLYARPFRTLYAGLGDDKPFEQAMADAERRLLHVAATDLQLAKTHTARQVLDADPRVTGYRRVLVGSVSCGLCVVASTQRYRKENLLPIHPGCDCAVAPIVGDTDPGQVINEPLLEDVHDAIATTFGKADRGGRAPDYRQFLVTHEHGEIGPVLARTRDRFTGPGDLTGGGAGGD